MSAGPAPDRGSLPCRRKALCVAWSGNAANPKQWYRNAQWEVDWTRRCQLYCVALCANVEEVQRPSAQGYITVRDIVIEVYVMMDVGMWCCFCKGCRVCLFTAGAGPHV